MIANTKRKVEICFDDDEDCFYFAEFLKARHARSYSFERAGVLESDNEQDAHEETARILGIKGGTWRFNGWERRAVWVS